MRLKLKEETYIILSSLSVIAGLCLLLIIGCFPFIITLTLLLTKGLVIWLSLVLSFVIQVFCGWFIYGILYKLGYILED